ncbi:MAG: calcium/sodium antiporter [Bdellovibrionota bacterium]|jgi:cation:H+ antiporter|nr:calcium/sodium antiporter [Bdellovibrionota bacterium]
MLVQVLILVLSIVALYYGAEFALEGAEKIGLYFGLSPLVVGLVLIGFGTSLPEFFVSQIACWNNEPGIALGNIVGSNIANLFLIMGISGLVTPLFILQKSIKRQMVIHILLTALLAVVILYFGITPLASVLLFLFFIFFLWDTFREMRKERQLRSAEDEEEVEKLELFIFGKLVIGFVFLYFGGEYLVSSGTALGKELGVPAYVISAVFVAFGTSFPELVTAMIACVKKKNTDLITGNIIGSNIFNVAFVMGSIGLYDIKITQNFNQELILLGAASVFLLLLVLLKKNFGRLPGAIFLSSYGYTVYYWVSH